jgi:hypothetical protein
MCKYVEDRLPSNIRVRVVHLHPGNTSVNQLKKHGKTNTKYVTIARLYDDNSEWDYPIATGVAACSSKDNPSRQVGRQVAVGRAMRAAGVTA